MTEKTKPSQPGDQPAERAGTIKPTEKAVADSRDRSPLRKQDLETKAHEESPTRPPRPGVSGLFGKQHLSHVHRIEKGETLKSVVQKRLGANASEEEIHHHMKEVARISGFKDHSEIKPGHAVQFPEKSESEVSQPVPPEQHPAKGLQITKTGDTTTAGTDTKATGGAFSEFDAVKLDVPQKLQSLHTIKYGETPQRIARDQLGPSANEVSVDFYAAVICVANNLAPTQEIEAKQMPAGQQIELPHVNPDGSATFQRKADVLTYFPSGDLHVANKDGTSYDRWQTDNNNSYKEVHTGPKPEDRYIVEYSGIEHTHSTTHTDKNGSVITESSDGTIKTVYANQDYELRLPSRQIQTYDHNANVVTDKFPDGSKILYYAADATGRGAKTESYEPDGSRTTKFSNGSVLIEDPAKETGIMRTQDHSGGYSEEGWGPQPKDNYKEQYDPKSGITTRIEAEGTPLEKKTMQQPNGILTIENVDGTGHQRNPDGSEHYFGPEAKDNYVVKPDQKLVDQARENLESAIHQHIAPEKLKMFEADMQTFESRLKGHHISSDEAVKTYDQLTRLLNADDTTAVVPAANRATCATSLMHQLAYPEHTDQGQHLTCNVTTVAERLITKEPSKAAEMVATTALTGNWRAPDGKLISVGLDSLQPGLEEIEYPPKVDGARSFCTQILNLVMANDATQRRMPPEYYRQTLARNTFIGDTGERLFDQHGKVINEMSLQGDQWQSEHAHAPGMQDDEISKMAARMLGDDHFFLCKNGLTGALDGFSSQQELEDKLKQMHDQNKFPAIIQVDCYKQPFRKDDLPTIGSHVVSITNYDPVHHKVKISNQWGIKSDQWVDAGLLYHSTI